MTSILAIDPGTSMGFARHVQGRDIEAGRMEWKVKKGIQPGVKLADFRRWLVGIMQAGHECPNTDLLIVEAPLVGGRQSSMAANRSAYGWNSVAEEVAATYGISYVEVYNNTIKKFATGDGRAEKPLILFEAIQKWPHLFPENIRSMKMVGTQQVGKKTVGVWDPWPDPKLFEISDALWILQWARENVTITS
jgi:hypothetical protein